MAMDSPTPSLRDQGMAALRDKDLDKAVDLLARAVMANVQDADAKALLGIAYCQKGLHAQAKRALQTAIELQPNNANFKYNLGVVLEHAGDQQGAAVAFNDTLKLSPEHAQAKAKLAAMGPQAQSWIAGAPSAPAQPPLGGTYGAAPAPPAAPPSAPPLGGTYGAPPPAAPSTPPLGGTYGAPPPPPAAPPPGGTYGAPPAPPAAPPLGGTYGAPPPPPAAPPLGGTYGAPPPPPGATYGAPPPPPAGGTYGAPPAPPAGGTYGAPPPPPGGASIPGFGAPPPPPPGAGAPVMPPPPIGNVAAVPAPMGMATAPMTPAGEPPAGTVQCPSCGGFPPAAMLCQFCSHPLPPPPRISAPAGPVDRPYVNPPVNMAPDMSNGEAFFRRLGALVIDNVILGVLGQVIGMIMTPGAASFDPSDPSSISKMLAPAGAQLGVIAGIRLAYFVVMTALTGQTLGKMALGLIVVGEDGEKAGFGAVLLRETIGKWISGCVFSIGYLAVLWSDDQKAWHDSIAHTQVVRK